MNKLLLAISIFSAGTLVFARFNQEVAQGHTSTVQCRAECERLTNRVNELASLEIALQAQIQLKKTRLNQSPASDLVDAELLSFLFASQSKDWKAPSLALRQSLGIGWDNSPEYILVSKAALKRVRYSGIDGSGKLAPTVCNVAALTDEERINIEAALQRADVAYKAWFNSAIERLAPSGEILAEYRVPANLEFAKQTEREAKEHLGALLGPDRVKLLEQFAGRWLIEHGRMGQDSIRFTVRYTSNRQPPLWWQVESADKGGYSSDVRPKDFPELFRGIFPGEWRELAQREGFELPQDFDHLPQPSSKP